ncbi:hypothetical protein [Nitrospira sp. Nam80]
MSAVPFGDNKKTGAISVHDQQGGQYRLNIFIVGVDSIGIFQQRNARGRRSVAHFTGRLRRDLARPIPRHTEAVVVVLDQVTHALARKIRIEAGRRGLPIVYQSAHMNAADGKSHGLARLRALK